ncbi:hypothetical protein SteCoe_1534 [Stentor coeruleus]|uniref:Uncharacterized protein n=1 Tax=Stentor coeruleus TaxID=5963 RepID=A0A1R2D1S5_9CILI|nr:hypothetical protein SteCoe_1534 [Stentor coeruleus]
MESKEVKDLKSKVKHIQLSKARQQLEQEKELSKQKSLELKKVIDLAKSKQVLKSLMLKRQLEDSKNQLQDSKITWSAELQNLHNSHEQYNTSQLKKKYLKEKLFNELYSLIALAQREFSLEWTLNSPTNIKDIQSNLENSTENLDYYNKTDSTNQSTLAFIKNIDSIKEKIKNFTSSYQKPDFLNEVEEKIEVSCDTQINISLDNLESEINIQPMLLTVLETQREENIRETVQSESGISIKQPEEEQIDENMISNLYDCVEMTTCGNQVITKGDSHKNYIVNDEIEEKEETLDVSKYEVVVNKRTWKYWLCPCMFKV